MTFDFDPIYLIYILVAASAGLMVEGVYLLCFSGASYRKNVNRRLKLLKEGKNKVAVNIGISNGAKTEVLSGLKEGDQVVLQ